MIDRNRLVSLSLVLALAAPALVACGNSGTSESAGGKQEEQQSQIANPFVDCSSASEAAELAGFEVTFPEAVPGYSHRAYQAVEGQMVQCIYSEGDQKVLVRKAVDDGSEDISGDYNEYSQVTEAVVRGITVMEKGENDLVHVATWSLDGYLFAIDADAGLDAATVEEIVIAMM